MSLYCPHCGGEPPLSNALMELLYRGVKAERLRIDDEHPDNEYTPSVVGGTNEKAIMHFTQDQGHYRITLERLD